MRNNGWKQACSVVAIVASAAGAMAQDANNDTVEFEEILVTASKRGAASVQDIPNNISAVGELQLENTLAQGLEDIAGQVAGLKVTRSGPGNNRVQIRGLSGNAQVSVYMDEIPFNAGAGNIGQTDLMLYDLERVEVLRGPQGTLYGSGSQGGTIRYIVNKPDVVDFAASTEVDLALASRGAGWQKRFNGMVNAPIVEDKLALRVVGFYRDVDGYVDLPEVGTDGLEDTNDEETYGGRALLSWKLGDNTDLLATALYQRTDVGNSSLVTEASDSRSGTIAEPFYDDLQMYNLTVNHQFDSGVLTLTGSVFSRDALNVFDVSQFVPRPGSVNQAGPRTGKTFEGRYASNFDGAIQFVAGVFYQRNTGNTTSIGYFVDPETGLVPDGATKFFDTGSETRFTNKSVFGEVTWEVADRVSLVAGGRFFEMGMWSQAREDLSPFGPPGGLADPLTYNTGTKFAGKAQAFVEWTEDMLTYLTFSQGFRQGGANNPALRTQDDEPVPAGFDPDYVDNYEFGWKTQWLDNQLTLNGALYYMRFKEVQTSVRDLTQAFNYRVNAGLSSLKGIELEAVIRPDALQGFSLSGNVSISEQQLLEDAVDGSGQKGQRLPGTAPFSWGIVAEQSFNIGDYDGFANFNMSYVGKAGTTFDHIPSFRETGGYALANAQIGIRGEGWNAALYSRNLFNSREVVGWRVEARPGIPDRIITTQPRIVGVKFGLDF
ncbi:MAG: TonB-dependent receptor [Kordiimonas sp.]